MSSSSDEFKNLNRPISDYLPKDKERENPKELTYADISPMKIPLSPTNQTNQTDQNLASGFYERLTKWIKDFDESLKDDYETGVQLVNFGQSTEFYIEHIGYWDPSLISFTGHKEDGSPVKLIQHVTQISILLVKMKRQSPENPKKPIGFIWEEQ